MRSTIVGLVAVVLACCFFTTASALNCSAKTTCSECVKNIRCFWCASFANDNRTLCDQRDIFQLKTRCPSTYHLYPSCAISGLTVLILVAVTITIVLIAIMLIVYCCCCRQSSGSRFRRQEERDQGASADRRRRQDERRQERQTRIADIRQKYGLSAEERYQKM